MGAGPPSQRRSLASSGSAPDALSNACIFAHRFKKCYLLTHLLLARGLRDAPWRFVPSSSTVTYESGVSTESDVQALRESVTASLLSQCSLGVPPESIPISVLKHGARRLIDASTKEGVDARQSCFQRRGLPEPRSSTHVTTSHYRAHVGLITPLCDRIQALLKVAAERKHPIKNLF